jgi:hypothetical protein
MFLFLVNDILALDHLTKKVTDTNGSPLSGATIKVKTPKTAQLPAPTEISRSMHRQMRLSVFDIGSGKK